MSGIGSDELPVGHCVYVVELDYEDRDGSRFPRYKIGRTKNINRRLMEHRRTLAGFGRIIYHRLCEEHEFLESCVHAGLRQIEIESEIFISNPKEAIETIEHCFSLYENLCNFTRRCRNTTRII